MSKRKHKPEEEEEATLQQKKHKVDYLAIDSKILGRQLEYGRLVADLVGCLNNSTATNQLKQFEKIVGRFEWKAEYIPVRSMLHYCWNAPGVDYGFFDLVLLLIQRLDVDLMRSFLEYQTQAFDIYWACATIPSTYRAVQVLEVIANKFPGILPVYRLDHVGHAFSRGNFGLIPNLIQAGCNPNGYSLLKTTPLMQIVVCRPIGDHEIDVLATLLSRIPFSELNFNCVTKEGKTLLQQLERNERSTVQISQVRILLENAEHVWKSHLQSVSERLSQTLLAFPTPLLSLIHDFLFAQLVVVTV
jgi:hypothetical protein